MRLYQAVCQAVLACAGIAVVSIVAPTAALATEPADAQLEQISDAPPEPNTRDSSLTTTAVGLIGYGSHQLPQPSRPNTNYGRGTGAVAGFSVAASLPSLQRRHPTLRVGLDYLSTLDTTLEQAMPDGTVLERPFRSHQLAATVQASWVILPQRDWLNVGVKAGYAHEQMNSHLGLPFHEYAGLGFIAGVPVCDRAGSWAAAPRRDARTSPTLARRTFPGRWIPANDDVAGPRSCASMSTVAKTGAARSGNLRRQPQW